MLDFADGAAMNAVTPRDLLLSKAGRQQLPDLADLFSGQLRGGRFFSANVCSIAHSIMGVLRWAAPSDVNDAERFMAGAVASPCAIGLRPVSEEGR